MTERVYIIVVGETTRNIGSCTQHVYIVPEREQYSISALRDFEKEKEPYPHNLEDPYVSVIDLSQYKIDNLTYDYTTVEVLGLVALTY